MDTLQINEPVNLLESLVVDATRTMVGSGKMKDLIEKQIEKTLASIVAEQLGTYSDFGKTMTSAVKEAIAIDPKDIGLHGYNRAVLDIVKRKLESAITSVGTKKISDEMEELLGLEAPAEIKLSDLIEEFRRWAAESEESKRATIILTETAYGSRWLYLDPSQKVDKYRCKFSMLISADGKTSAFKIDDTDPQKTIFAGKCYGFERRMFQMYAAGTRVVVDQESFSEYLGDYDD